MNKRNFFLQTSHGIASYIEQELKMTRGVHFRFVRVVPSYKVLTLWLSINPTYTKKLKGMVEELSLAAMLPKGDLVRTELGGRGVIEIQIPLPVYLRASPPVSRLPRLPGCQTAVGLDVENKAATINFDNPLTAHCLIAGLTGSGKTNLGRLLVYLLAHQNEPANLRFLLFDIADGGLAWEGFGNLPHLYHGVVSDMQTAKEGMEWLAGELARRAIKRETRPKLIVGIDEVQVFAKEPEIAEALEVLSQRGRKWGVSLILATQRPVKDSLSTTTKANMGIRIVGKVATSQESAWASGLADVGGETLSGLGDMLLCKHGGGVQRIAAPLFTDKDLADLPRNGREWVEFPRAEGEDTSGNGGDPDFTTTEYVLSLIGARYGKGRPWLKDVLESETGHKPGSKRANRLLAWGREAHQILNHYRYQLALTPDP